MSGEGMKQLELTEDQLKALRRYIEKNREQGEMQRHLRVIYRKLTNLWLDGLPFGTRNIVVEELVEKAFSTVIVGGEEEE